MVVNDGEMGVPEKHLATGDTFIYLKLDLNPEPLVVMNVVSLSLSLSLSDFLHW